MKILQPHSIGTLGVTGISLFSFFFADNSDKDSQQDGFFQNTPNQVLSILFLLTILAAILWFAFRRFRNKEKAPIATEGVVNVNKHAEA